MGRPNRGAGSAGIKHPGGTGGRDQYDEIPINPPEDNEEMKEREDYKPINPKPEEGEEDNDEE